MLKKIVMLIVALSVLTACSSAKFTKSYPEEGVGENIIFSGSPLADDPGDEPSDAPEEGSGN